MLGIVTIGRNEGERLRRCLQSVQGQAQRVVYVDSGSDDGSVTLARSLGADVIQLDAEVPFTMARGRNAGFRRLRELEPRIQFVQFVDGDCGVVAGWLERARQTLTERGDVAIVSGRRRERRRNATVYNRLTDMEWDTPIGETKAVLGDMCVRADVFEQMQGFNPAIIAAEDDELCVRVRQRGWKILRLDADMTIHDAAMTRFGQLWKRMVRAGHGFAEGRAMHGAPPERHFVKQVRRIWFWAAVVPLLGLGLAVPSGGWSLLLLLLYPVSVAKTFAGRLRHGDSGPDACRYAVFALLAKFSGLIGMLIYFKNRLFSRPSVLIEYK